MSRSGPDSRLSMTNRADDDSGRPGPSTAETLRKPLTERNGVKLRSELIELDGDLGVSAVSLNRAMSEFANWYRDDVERTTVFENPEGEEVSGYTPNRFHPDYSEKQYAKLKDLERGVKRDYGRRLHTAMLTLTASSAPFGEALPVVDHYEELMSSWDAVRRALHRVMGERRWEYLAILEPHKSGYVHVHIAVFVDGKIVGPEFEPVIDAHLKHCDYAGEEAHDVTDDSTVSVRYAGGRGGGEHLDELAIYLGEYLGTYNGDSPLEEPVHVKIANTVLWGKSVQAWRPSNGAQQYMATERRDDCTEWELVAIEDGDGDRHEVFGGGGVVSTGVTMKPPPD